MTEKRRRLGLSITIVWNEQEQRKEYEFEHWRFTEFPLYLIRPHTAPNVICRAADNENKVGAEIDVYDRVHELRAYLAKTYGKKT